LNFSDSFSKNFQVLHLIKVLLLGAQTDGRTDGQTGR